MYDTISFGLNLAANPEFIKTTEALLNLETKTYFNQKKNTFSCKWNNFNVRVCRYYIFFSGSLPTFYKGSNANQIHFKEIKDALDILEDMLDIPLKFFKIHRLDLGYNIEVEQSPEKYWRQFIRHNRHEWKDYENGCYFLAGKKMVQPKVVIFYDKIKQMKASNIHIPKEIEGKHIFRYELRWKKRISNFFGKITLDNLRDKRTYDTAIELWAEEFQKIKKIEPSSDDCSIKNMKDLQRVGIGYMIDKEFNGDIKIALEVLKGQGIELTKDKRKYWRNSLKASMEFYHSTRNTPEISLMNELNTKIENIKLQKL